MEVTADAISCCGEEQANVVVLKAAEEAPFFPLLQRAATLALYLVPDDNPLSVYAVVLPTSIFVHVDDVLSLYFNSYPLAPLTAFQEYLM
ncbi:MAG: hypothetical protein NZM08_01710 [Chitinophagales bacterium]|nr:hypothetical protein [Chitinophagales bacterium]